MGLKSTVSVKLANFSELQAGIEYNAYAFNNSIAINDIDNGSFERFPSLLALFVEDKITAGRFSIRPGIRATNYNNGTWMYEPRINAAIQLPGQMKLKLAYGEYLQYIISMNSAEIEMTQIVDYYYPLGIGNPANQSITLPALKRTSAHRCLYPLTDITKRTPGFTHSI